MPQLQNVVINDRKATPVAHTYTPRDIVANVGTVVEAGTVPIGNNSLSVSLRKTPQGKYKGELRMVSPIVQTQIINGVSTPVVVRTSYVNLECTFDSTSTEDERKDAIGLMANALGASVVLVNDTLVKLQGVY